MQPKLSFLGFFLKLRRASRELMVSPFMEKLRGSVRVAAYASFAFGVLGLLALRSALGNVSEQALVIGRQLASMEEFTARSTRLSLNGQYMNIASASTEQPVQAVLERYASLCRDGSVVGELATTVKGERPAPSRWEKLGILSEIADDEGFVACIAQKPGQEQQSLFEGLKKFSDSRDLGDVGLVRYAYARRTKAGRTQVITTWTDGSFLVSALMAADGDSPGTDPSDAPRPLNSRRFLTAQVEGEPDSVRVYESRATAVAVLAQYDQTLPQQGWKAIEEVAREAPQTRHYTRDGVDTVVVAAQNGERAAVTVIQIRSE